MQPDDLIGTMLGNYRILAPLGQGGMARVYKALQENLDREVAIKVLPPWYAADRSFVERFNLEARLVARLSHPNIVTVHDASEQDGHIYIVMQLVDGGTLKQQLDQLHLQGRVMTAEEATPIFRQLADALTYAHEQSIIHRDIKPVNVLLDRSGRPILSDFGIAKALANTKEHLTRPGAGVGTPEYMSPEQCQGIQVDGRADIYALGVMLFEALTGCTPFQGDNYPALAHSHIYETPPRPGAINPAITPVVERVILTALMKNPQQRYQRASDMGEALERALSFRQAGVQKMSPYPASSYVYEAASSSGTIERSDTARLPTHRQPGALASTMLFACLRCQHANKPQMKFCTRCGHPLNRCANCGAHNPANNRFCTKCGRTLFTKQ